MQLILLSVFLLGLVGCTLQCGQPGGDWTPKTIEERAHLAPLVVKAYLVKSLKNSFHHSRRCLLIEQIYKGSLHPEDFNYICADGFGDGAACLSDLPSGSPYIVFLNKVSGYGYEARYDDNLSAVTSPSIRSASEELRKGICCRPNTGCHRQLSCDVNGFGVTTCGCEPRQVRPKEPIGEKGKKGVVGSQ